MYLTNAKIRWSTDSVDLLTANMSVTCIQMNAIALMQHKFYMCATSINQMQQPCESTINSATAKGVDETVKHKSICICIRV